MTDWNFDLLESLIQDRGDAVTVETGVRCPKCTNEDPYASMIDYNGRPTQVRSHYCPMCDGNGYIYRNARCVLGLITSVQPSQRDLMDAGYASPGDATFSPSLNAGYIGDFDRVTMGNPTQVDGGQVIVRGAAHLSTNAALVTDLAPNQDRIWYLPQCVQWCEDLNGVVYTYGQDFTFVDKKIVWSNGPDDGVAYVLKYRAYMEWIVYASPMERFDRGRNLAQRVLLRKKHVHFINSALESPVQRSENQALTNTFTRL